MVTTQWLQLDQILPLSVKGVACLTTPSYAYHLPFILHVRVSYRGGGGGGGAEFPPPRNPEIEYGYYISYLHVTEHKYVSSKCCLEICPRLCQKQSERM